MRHLADALDRFDATMTRRSLEMTPLTRIRCGRSEPAAIPSGSRASSAPRSFAPGALVAATLAGAISVGAQQAAFRAGVDLVTVAVTVTDGDGRFISGLTKDDFIVSDDRKPQDIVSFSSERVPVSLAIVLDVSASMTEARMATARRAIEHFSGSLLGKDDELFLMEFAARGRVLQPWTFDRAEFSRALEHANQKRIEVGDFGSAVFDAVATSIEFAAKGTHVKKAVLLVSDGKDTVSRRSVKQVQEAIRQSEVLVYGLAVDGGREKGFFGYGMDGGVDAGALRKLTDDTGGRTEVVKGYDKLSEATARLADEFNRQYVMSYNASSVRDGRWHAIKVDVRKRGAKVRARAGYLAS